MGQRRLGRTLLVSIVFILLVGMVLTTGAAPTSAQKPQLGSNRLLYVLDYSRRVSDADVASFSGAILQINSPAERVATLKGLNPKIVLLYYRAAYITWTWEPNWPTINAHEDWFAHGHDGRRVVRSGNSSAYLMDLGNAAYREYIISYIVNVVRMRGFDGAFIDGPPSSMKGIYTRPGITAAFRDFYHDDAVRWLRELKAALGSKLLVTNSTSKSHDWRRRAGYPNPDPDYADDDFVPIVDGTMIEGFAHAPWEPPTAIQGPTQWNWQQAKFQRNLDAGRAVFVLPGVKGGTAEERGRWAVFSYASFLLRTDNKRSWFLWDYGDDVAEHHFPELDIDLEAAVGGPYLANGVWQRDFLHGKVLVNASGGTRTVDLLWPLRLLDGTAATRVSLQPWTAIILRN